MAAAGNLFGGSGDGGSGGRWQCLCVSVDLELLCGGGG